MFDLFSGMFDFDHDGKLSNSEKIFAYDALFGDDEEHNDENTDDINPDWFDEDAAEDEEDDDDFTDGLFDEDE